jgi:hypothetical protein
MADRELPVIILDPRHPPVRVAMGRHRRPPSCLCRLGLAVIPELAEEADSSVLGSHVEAVPGRKRLLAPFRQSRIDPDNNEREYDHGGQDHAPFRDDAPHDSPRSTDIQTEVSQPGLWANQVPAAISEFLTLTGARYNDTSAAKLHRLNDN